MVSALRNGGKSVEDKEKIVESELALIGGTLIVAGFVLTMWGGLVWLAMWIKT